MNATQTDIETVAVSWGGFFDHESNIKEYTVCIGSVPQGVDYGVNCTPVNKDLSTMYVGLEMPKYAEAGELAYLTVFATNGEGHDAVGFDTISASYDGPTVVDWAVEDAFGRLVSQPIVKLSDPSRVNFQVAMAEPLGDATIEIVEVAVSDHPSAFQSGQEWTELPFPFANTQGQLWSMTLSSQTMKHNVAYYIHIRGTSTIGIQRVTTLPVQLYVDFTPSILSPIPHTGNSIMMEDTLDWLPLDVPEPEFSATYWMAGTTWEVMDPEGTEPHEYVVELHDARDGHPDSPVATIHLPASATVAMFHGLKLPHLSEFEFRVRCRNKADAWGEARSARVKMDLTRPEVVQVIDLAGVQTAPPLASAYHSQRHPPVLLTEFEQRDLEVDFVASFTNQLIVGFAAWDIDSGISGVKVAVGIAPGDASVLPWTRVAMQTPRQAVVPVDTALLSTHTRYFVSVISVNVRWLELAARDLCAHLLRG